MSEEGAAVCVSRLTRRFGARRALDDVSLEVATGERFGLLGTNGAGKTTLLRLVAGLILPTSGRLTVLGLRPDLEPDAVRARIGYVPEVAVLYDELRVDEFLAFVAGARGLRGRAAREAVERQVARFDLAEQLPRRCGRLSQGLRRRVTLAQGFLGEPELVVLDEPTAGLDPVHRESVHQFLAGGDGATTLLLSSHDLEEVRLLTGRAALLRGGQLVRIGATAEVLADGVSIYRDARGTP